VNARKHTFRVARDPSRPRNPRHRVIAESRGRDLPPFRRNRHGLPPHRVARDSLGAIRPETEAEKPRANPKEPAGGYFRSPRTFRLRNSCFSRWIRFIASDRSLYPDSPTRVSASEISPRISERSLLFPRSLYTSQQKSEKSRTSGIKADARAPKLLFTSGKLIATLILSRDAASC